MTVFRRFYDRFMSFLCVYVRFLPLIFIIRIPVERLKNVINDRKRSLNDRKLSETLWNGERSGTPRNVQVGTQ